MKTTIVTIILIGILVYVYKHISDQTQHLRDWVEDNFDRLGELSPSGKGIKIKKQTRKLNKSAKKDKKDKKQKYYF